jgi:hypothetical protein
MSVFSLPRRDSSFVHDKQYEKLMRFNFGLAGCLLSAFLKYIFASDVLAWSLHFAERGSNRTPNIFPRTNI